MSHSNLLVPETWRQIGHSTIDDPRTTQSCLVKRKKEGDLPHKSYDIGCYGGISHKDFKIAKFFDKDRDGRLNS